MQNNQSDYLQQWFDSAYNNDYLFIYLFVYLFIYCRLLCLYRVIQTKKTKWHCQACVTIHQWREWLFRLLVPHEGFLGWYTECLCQREESFWEVGKSGGKLEAGIHRAPRSCINKRISSKRNSVLHDITT